MLVFVVLVVFPPVSRGGELLTTNLSLLADTNQALSSIERAQNWITPAISGVAFFCVIGVAWVVMLRMRIRQQTEQIRQQHARKTHSDARYRDLFDNAGDAVWETDSDGRILFMNRAAEELLGRTSSEAVDHLLGEFLLPEERSKSRGSAIRNVFKPYEITVLPRDGTPIAVEVSSRVLPDRTIQTIARNITERKSLQERALRVQKLEAVGRLAGGISHDFNNLLTVINGNAELLVMATATTDPNRYLTTEILDAGNRAANLTRQLLAFSRQRRLENSPLDLNAVITNMTVLLRRLIGEQIQMVSELDPQPPWLYAEVGLIEQILMNLVLNARDAMPRGGTLTIRTRTLATGFAHLIVVDTGSGMDQATQSRLFEPFFTTKPIGQGTGLGLATVYGIVQSLDGQIRYESAIGHGTMFEVELPLLSAQTSQPLPPKSAPSSPPTPSHFSDQPHVVLLVEDDEAVREFAKNVLEMYKLTVLTAENGQEAIELVRGRTGRVDLIVTDVLMPQMTGKEMIEILRHQYPDLRVLFMSGYVGDECLLNASTTITEFLQKPFTVVDLMAKVRNLIPLKSEV